MQITTNYGAIQVELFDTLAPRTVANFLTLVDEAFYDGLVFHRVIANFMIQGGGYTPDYEYKSGKGAVPNESYNGVKNTRGTLAMARLKDPDSADTQFFINVKDNPHLDAAPGQAGYTVFGKVVARHGGGRDHRTGQHAPVSGYGSRARRTRDNRINPPPGIEIV